jgi:hypothetical protein
MALVVDASATLGSYFPDEITPNSGGCAPASCGGWRTGSGSLVVRDPELADRGRTSGRVRASQTEEILAQLEYCRSAMTGSRRAAPCSPSRAHRLTVYDAAYLELALRADAALATLDRQLAAAARAAQVPLLGEGDLR